MKIWLVRFGLQESEKWENETELKAASIKEASEKAFELFKQWLDPQGKQEKEALQEKFAYSIEIKK